MWTSYAAEAGQVTRAEMPIEKRRQQEIEYQNVSLTLSKEPSSSVITDELPRSSTSEINSQIIPHLVRLTEFDGKTYTSIN